MPGDRRAPIVAGDDRLLGSERIEQAHHVADQMKERVLIGRCRLVRLAVAAHVRRDSVEAGGRQSGKLMAPRVPGFGKAVAQNDERPFALLGKMQLNAVRLDGALCDRVRYHSDLPL